MNGRLRRKQRNFSVRSVLSGSITKTQTSKNKNENPDYHRPKSAWTHLRRVRSECVPALHSHVAAARPGWRFHESALRQPLFLRRGGPANCRRRDLPARTLCGTGLDAAWPGDREHFVVPPL